MKFTSLRVGGQKILDKKEIVIIYHAGCDDGFGAAYAAWKVFKEKAFYYASSHGYIPLAMHGKKIYILDFSYPKEIIQKYQETNEVVLIDHHKTAYDELKDLSCCHFDLSHSGCILAWNYFHPDTPAPKLLQYIEDIDLWKFSFQNVQDFSIALRSSKPDFVCWDLLAYDENEFSKLIEKGKIINIYFNQQLKNIEKNARSIMIDGIPGYILNANTCFASDIGSLLAEKNGTFCIVWNEVDKIEGAIKCSLRSTDKVDCSKIAQKFGGGGHPKAAAFVIKSLAEFNKLKFGWEAAWKLKELL